MTEITTVAPGRRRPLLIAAAVAVAALIIGAVALFATGDDDGPPRLDLSAAAPAGAAEGGGERMAESADIAMDGAAGASMMAAWARYVAGDELDDMGGSAPVYRLVADDDDLRAIAEHLGVQGEVTDADGNQRTITDGDASVNGYGASWWYTSGQPYPGSEDAAPDTAVSCDANGVCEEPAPIPEPERPADLPSQAEAEQIIRDVAAAAGLDLAGAQVTSYDNVTTWGVNIELALDGTPIPGWSVYGTVMAGGEILDAGGTMGGLEEVGDYPLDTTRVAIDRLNEQSADAPGATEPGIEPMPLPEETEVVGDPATGEGVEGSEGSAGSASSDDGAAPSDPVTQVAPAPGDAVAEPAPAPDEMTIMPVDEGGEPITVTLRSAERSYTMYGNADGTETYLVPVYLLDGEDDRGEEWLDVFALAVQAEFLGA